MHSNLSTLFEIQEILKQSGYPDYKRISLEVQDFLDTSQINRNDLFKKLKKGEPWEYIRGYTQFCGIDFKVTKDTLIPRVETEQIVYESLRLLQKEDIKNIVDVGTGTGCIPISIAKLGTLPYSIYATDISKDALKVARENEQNILQVSRINWIETNLIKDLEDIQGPTILTANLPYIPASQYAKLDKSVLNYEPEIALKGGIKGTEIYERLFEQILNKQIGIKYILLETETSIFNETVNLAKEYFENTQITPLKDIYQRDRFLLISFL